MNARNRSGFSLVEIMMVAGLVGFIMTGVMTFYVQSLYSGNTSEQQIELVSTMRSFTNEMVFNGSRSHEFVLYSSAASEDRTVDNRLLVLNDDTETTSDDICPTGNFAVFVYYELPKPSNQATYRIAKLIGYYVEDVDEGPPQLVRMTIDLSGSPSSDSVEDILDDNWNSATRRTIAPRVLPLALSDGYTESTEPRLFYKRANQNIAVCGQLLQSNTDMNTKDLRTHTRTFYFTVTVRS